MPSLDWILRQSAQHHRHLCPRQVLGARMSLLAGERLGLEIPRPDKRLLVIAETDGCGVDGIIAATGCHVGSRTLRILDFGKLAATFIDTRSSDAIRFTPKPNIRSLARDVALQARNRWEAMLIGYQIISAEDLFKIQPVRLNIALTELISKPTLRTECSLCGEEISNGREVLRDGLILCRSCAGESYYELKEVPLSLHQISTSPVPIV